MSFSSKFAMVVDDDASFRAATELMLRRMGFKSVVAEEDGELAWDHLNHVRFDFILSDWSMEPMDGLQLLRRVRSNPQLSRIGFVLMSADLSLKPWREAIEAGATDFLLKPFAWRQLRETVEFAFSRPSANQTNIIKFPKPSDDHENNTHGGADTL